MADALLTWNEDPARGFYRELEVEIANNQRALDALREHRKEHGA
jgi:hypothetical protein